MTRSDLGFRLSGAQAPEGEIGMGELAAVAGALQELATRIGRFSVDQRGPGRTHAAVEAVTRLRLTGISEGSTTLRVAYGQTDVLSVELELEQETKDRFVEIVGALATGSRPDWTPDLVAESALTLLDAFKKAAESVDFTSSAGDPVRIHPDAAQRGPWQPRSRVSEGERSAVGRLEAVDLRSGRFRIRDDVGNAISLEHVMDAEVAATLINQRVAATGESNRGPRGEMPGLTSPRVEAAPLPSAWTHGRVVDWSSELDKPGPDALPPVELTEEEFESFIASIKG